MYVERLLRDRDRLAADAPARHDRAVDGALDDDVRHLVADRRRGAVGARSVRRSIATHSPLNS